MFRSLRSHRGFGAGEYLSSFITEVDAVGSSLTRVLRDIIAGLWVLAFFKVLLHPWQGQGQGQDLVLLSWGCKEDLSGYVLREPYRQLA